MAKDIFHFAVKEALKKDNWLVSHDPYELEVWDSATYEIDFGAEKILAAEKGGVKIAVEVKSFTTPSLAHEFHKALGQYLNYQTFMEIQEPDRVLFLAVTRSVYDKFFTKKSTELVLQKFKVNLVIFNPDEQIIEKWIEK